MSCQTYGANVKTVSESIDLIISSILLHEENYHLQATTGERAKNIQRGEGHRPFSVSLGVVGIQLSVLLDGVQTKSRIFKDGSNISLCEEIDKEKVKDSKNGLKKAKVLSWGEGGASQN